MNKNSITLAQFQQIVSAQPVGNQRVGQAMLYRLYDTNKHVANEVSYGAADPFYDDTKIPAFIKWLSEKIAAQVALPEGFVKFEATENSVCPCNPRDVVLVCLKRNEGKPNSSSTRAENYTWNTSSLINLSAQIIGYKIEKKYVEPRPMKYSEMPVGQVFMWSFSKDKAQCDRTVFIKTNASQQNSFGEVLNCVSLSGVGKGCLTFFRELDKVFYFEASFDGKIGELLTVKE